ncbi:uncharacterized protein PHACADRAFT_179367 [Phanerochaete carnosa HHB-10118-sp]|uniref:Uncharacterized protein n=1 Tax=Phanerochaete carnosa (strain HHB-10118-sp) TaxID=650164 RepID=K5VR03_PHACS|nr:uncharacterized protein PHACADRAFT_179367 [Phanerochaete carnosa HHB-10118-sp]EKM49004.1 hypothetical protein PHACADRAFT_179367 [Phanerochaete carnosa HHB-10118-sp]
MDYLAVPTDERATTPTASIDSAETISSIPSTSGLDAALAAASQRALSYEMQIKDLEGKLAEDLSNSRAIDNLLREVVQGLQQTQKRSSTALTSTVPYIDRTLQEDLETLHDLGNALPEIGMQVKHIRQVYDHGRDKAQELVDSLEWLNTPIPLRLRTIIFTSNAPVSARWKVLIRFLFTLAFLMCMWIAWITLRGAVRAHRQRLVWGERLMS